MNKRSIVHIEIPAADRKAAARFYGELFGWEFQHVEEPVPYSLFESGNIGGGLPDVSDYYRPGDVLVYISSADIDADLDSIESHGGQRMGDKFEIPGMGWFAFFADPTGNRLALWKDLSQPQTTDQ
ncbi:MAG: VOC family protein [Ardenticatenaceae bacterium]